MVLHAIDGLHHAQSRKGSKAGVRKGQVYSKCASPVGGATNELAQTLFVWPCIPHQAHAAPTPAYSAGLAVELRKPLTD